MSCSPARPGANEQPEGADISEVPAVGWMLCNYVLQQPSARLQGFHTTYVRLPRGSQGQAVQGHPARKEPNCDVNPRTSF